MAQAEAAGGEKLRWFVREKSFYRRFFSMMGLVALQNLLVFAVNLADNIMLGNFSEPALSGAALANQFQFLLQMLVMGVSEGASVLMARYWGQKNIGAIRKLTGMAMRMNLLVQLVMWGAVFFFPHQMLGMLTNDAAVLEEGVKYIRIVCFTYPLFTITSTLNLTLRSVETAHLGFVTSAAALFINIGLNYLLIFGNLGAPRMGSQGAAVATLAARAVELVIILCYILFRDKKVRLRLRDFFTRDRELFRAYIRIGFPVLVSNGMWGVAQMVQTGILGNMSATAIAANSVATTIFQVISVLVMGMGSPVAVIIGKTIGEGKQHKVKQYAVTLQIIFLIVGAFSGLLLFCVKDAIIGFYDLSAESRALALQFATVLSVTIVGTAYQAPSLTGIVRGGGDTSFVMKNDFIFQWFIVLPAAMLAAFVFHAPPLIVFICLKSDQITKCAVAVVKVNRFRWIKSWGPVDKIRLGEES